MQFDKNIVSTKNGAIVSVHLGAFMTTNLFNDEWYAIKSPTLINEIINLTNKIKNNSISDNEIITKVSELRNNALASDMEKYNRSMTLQTNPELDLQAILNGVVNTTTQASFGEQTTQEQQQENQQEQDNAKIQETKKEIVENIFNFFSEFDFVPCNRFFNTLSKNAKNKKTFNNYILNYFKLSDNNSLRDIVEKMKSEEWENITTKCIDFWKVNPSTTQINNRLVIYYGVAGGGKTTQAINNCPNTEPIVCCSSMQPSDLMQVFTLKNGISNITKSPLWLAMENGDSILLDEINLLPYDSIRFLQGLTDNKKIINFNGETINIKNGFKIYGTMNLYVNGIVQPLSESLIDRAMEITEFVPNKEFIYQVI